jgi:sugar lactone lactonase YvrE
MATTQTRAFSDGFIFLEGPRWHAGTLWVSDMMDRRVYRVTEAGQRESVCQVPERPSGIGFLPEGTPIVSSGGDRKVMKILGDRIEVHADLITMASGDLNELITDADGRAYVGNFGYDILAGAPRAPAELILVEPSGAARVVARDLDFPNGTVIKDGGRTLVIAETWSCRLTAYDRAADGSLSGRRVYADLEGRSPDGLCLDLEGGIWVSCLDAGEFVRIVEGGHVTDRVQCPGRLAVACALGGSDGRSLFCSTYAGHLEDAMALKRNGAIEVASVAVPGFRSS